MLTSDPDHLLFFFFLFFFYRTFQQLRKISEILYLFLMTKYMRHRASINFFVSQLLQTTFVHDSDENPRILACLFTVFRRKKVI